MELQTTHNNTNKANCYLEKNVNLKKLKFYKDHSQMIERNNKI